MKQNTNLNLFAQLITLPFVIIMIVLLLGSITGYKDNENNIDKNTVKDTVEKYVIQCYASEGAYPPDLAYLSEHYGLILNEDKYIYEYDIFASNIMPDIIIHDAFDTDSRRPQ